MKTLRALAMALVVPALLVGCDDDDDLTGIDNQLVGDFEATDFGFVGTVDPALARDFDAEGATFTLSLRDDRTFESTFVEAPGATPLVRTGTFTVNGDQLLLGERALITGVQDGPQLFTFAPLSGEGLSLRSATDTRFDFDEDEAFEDDELGRFDLELTPF